MGNQAMKPTVFFATCLLVLCISTPVKAEKILLLGDSLSAAYRIAWNSGWAQQLAAEIADDHQLINASVSGETTGGGLARLPALLQEYDPDWVIVELGGNDGLRGYPLNMIKNNLQKIGELVVQADAQPIYFGVRIPANYGERYNSAFSSIFPTVADELDSPYLDLYIEEIALNPELMQSDKLHPSELAQPIIKRFVSDFLLPILDSNHSDD